MSISVLILIFEVTIMMAQKSFGVSQISNMQATIFIGVFSVGLAYDLEVSEKLVPYKSLLMIGYVIRVFMLYIDRYGNTFITLPGSGADSESFYEQALKYAHGETLKNPGAFVLVIGTVFLIIGTNRVYGQFILVLLSVISLITFALTLNKLSYVSVERKQYAYGMVCVLPNYAILSAVFLRESVVSMFITISLYFFVRYIYYKDLISIICSAAAVFFSMLFHSGTAGLIIGYIIVLFLYDNGRERINISLRNLLPALLIGIVTAFLYINGGEVLFRKFAHIEDISDIASGRSLGQSSYAEYVGNSYSVGNMLKFTPLRIFYFLYSPFPWQWRGIADVVACVFNSLYYALVTVKAFVYVKNSEHENNSLAIILMVILLCAVFVFSWGTANTGTAIRHRDKLVTVFALLHAACEYRNNSNSGQIIRRKYLK